MNDDHNITQLLAQVTDGSRSAQHELLPLVYDELRRMARMRMGRERRDHSLQPTALVHEAWLRFTRMQTVQWESRVHFFAVAAVLMRRILVDHAREQAAEKRGGAFSLVPLEGANPAVQPNSMQVLALHQALERLEALDARQARIVELRYFGGLTDEEISTVLGTSSRTVRRDWRIAKAFLFGELTR